MSDKKKTKDQLLDDIRELRSALQKLESDYEYESHIHDDEIFMPEHLLQTIPDIVYKVDPDGMFTYLNKAVSILGYTPEELIGKRFDIIVHPEDLKRVSRKHVLPRYKGKSTGPEKAPKLFDERRTGDRKTQSLEIRLVHNHKASRKVKDEDIMTGMLFSYGELSSSGHYRRGKGKKKHLGSIGVIHDVTPWKQAEIKLKESEQRYRMLVEDMPVLICRFKRDCTLTFVNKAYCDFFDCRAEDLVGKNWLEFLSEGERKKMKKKLRSLTKENPMLTYEHAVQAPEGNTRWQRWTDRILLDENGRIHEYQSIGFDVTERRMNEENLTKSEAALHDRNIQLQEKNIAIREMMEQLEVEKAIIEKRISANAENLILPLIVRLKQSGKPVTREQLDVLERNILKLTSSFADHISAYRYKLSQRETEVCNLIREGYSSKEIASILHLSLKTVENHRTKIRSKLEVPQTTKLHTFLLRITEPE